MLVRTMFSVRVLAICLTLLKALASEEPKSSGAEALDSNDAINVSSKTIGVSIDVPSKGKSIRSSSLELPQMKLRQTDGQKMKMFDDNFADLEGRISPESLELIRQIHGIKTHESDISRHKIPTSSNEKTTQQRSDGPTEFIDVTGKIEIL